MVLHLQRASNKSEDASNKDPYSEWTYDDFFREDALVMNSAVATPAVYKYATACLPAVTGESPECA